MSEGRREIACAGDADLDFDVSTRLRPVVRFDSPDLVELVIQGEGGVGGWDGNGDGIIEDCEQVTHVQIALGFHLRVREQAQRQLVMMMIDRIVQWGEDRAVVRITAAPGKLSTIYGPDGKVAVIPRA